VTRRCITALVAAALAAGGCGGGDDEREEPGRLAEAPSPSPGQREPELSAVPDPAVEVDLEARGAPGAPWQDVVQARPGRALEFRGRIAFAGVSGEEVRLRALLPPALRLVAGSERLVRSDVDGAYGIPLAPGLARGGVVREDFRAGEARVRFRARVSDDAAPGLLEPRLALSAASVRTGGAAQVVVLPRRPVAAPPPADGRAYTLDEVLAVLRSRGLAPRRTGPAATELPVTADESARLDLGAGRVADVFVFASAGAARRARARLREAPPVRGGGAAVQGANVVAVYPLLPSEAGRYRIVERAVAALRR